MTARLFGLATSLARMLLQAAGIVVLVFVRGRVVAGDAVDRTRVGETREREVAGGHGVREASDVEEEGIVAKAHEDLDAAAREGGLDGAFDGGVRTGHAGNLDAPGVVCVLAEADPDVLIRNAVAVRVDVNAVKHVAVVREVGCSGRGLRAEQADGEDGRAVPVPCVEVGDVRLSVDRCSKTVGIAVVSRLRGVLVRGQASNSNKSRYHQDPHVSGFHQKSPS